MAVTTSLRSDNFQLFLSLQSEIKDAATYITHLTKERGECIQFFAQLAAPLMNNAGKAIGTIIRCKLGQEETLSFLSQAALTLHRIWVRCADYAPMIASKALHFYQQIIAIFPSGTALQLELLGQGDYKREVEPPTLMLSTIASWWKRHAQGHRAPKTTASPTSTQAVQLCLDLNVVDTTDTATEETSSPTAPHEEWVTGDRIGVDGGCAGTITHIRRHRAWIQWDNGYTAQYTVDEMKRYRYYKLCEQRR
ncbi:hypothetical protein HCG51_08680 [Tolypothrix sp. PCC 7910]|uniref:hypothetical protein n=1 Tax=Tolypothrix sp. PCC 7910 TaxID=2099387 RepID=UPI00142790A2|nr:hypothetical protein [Tolypothrix sp. PCC 7910]QIR36810.1 hypothetical protein HCG51_08680 [Tolypothrix sp. PCC 7910]